MFLKSFLKFSQITTSLHYYQKKENPQDTNLMYFWTSALSIPCTLLNSKMNKCFNIWYMEADMTYNNECEIDTPRMILFSAVLTPYRNTWVWQLGSYIILTCKFPEGKEEN